MVFLWALVLEESSQNRREEHCMLGCHVSPPEHLRMEGGQAGCHVSPLEHLRMEVKPGCHVSRPEE